jgi:glycosyltransferase involved in cell wall biosynthesis
VPIKRIHIILEALAKLHFEIIWSHIGDGILLHDIKRDSKILGANVTVNFLGHLSNADVLNFYENNPVDLFINVSEFEGIPVSIMEAISFGIPTFATDVGGTAEIISENFGKLLPQDVSSFELANAIEEFVGKSEDEKMKMRLSAHKYWAENFNADINYKQFSDFLNENFLNPDKSFF